MLTYLEFEKPIAALEQRINELRDTATAGDIDIEPEVARLEAKSSKLLRETYAKLTPWQKTQVARHPERPHFKHYVAGLADDFMTLAGDRAFADDPAVIDDNAAHRRIGRSSAQPFAGQGQGALHEFHVCRFTAHFSHVTFSKDPAVPA